MAKIVIAGDAVVITSALKMEDLKTLEKYRPESMILYDEEKSPVFRIGIASCTGSIGAYCAEFNGASHDENGYATLTMMLSQGEGDARERVAEIVGSAIIKLDELEEKLFPVLHEVQHERDRVLEKIEVV